jgi:hypothetical protein
VNPVPRWRIAAAIAVLGALLGFGILFAPIYAGNLKLQSYVAEITHRVDSQNQPDETLRQNVLKRAHELDLPVKADNVQIMHSPDGLRIDVRYFVRVTLPGYTVDLHFYPGAGSR